MINLIRLDDDTDHGGEVISAPVIMSSDGIFVAGKGDESMADGDIPIARHGYKLPKNFNGGIKSRPSRISRPTLRCITSIRLG